MSRHLTQQIIFPKSFLFFSMYRTQNGEKWRKFETSEEYVKSNIQLRIIIKFKGQLESKWKEKCFEREKSGSEVERIESIIQLKFVVK